ncbi:MAG: hypothetical protein NTZ59_02350 [Bacteroidetes bacterium]|nr:hypothetical protein [Bacteroidota bacterium]
MRKLFLLVAVMFFSANLKAQKAYDYISYKGKWGNFSITLKYGAGYVAATTLTAVNSKTGARKVYSYNREGSSDNLKVCLSNTTNKTNYCIKSSELENENETINVAISWDDNVEFFEMKKVK